jgi:methyltransferase (TIGR00027 family)
MLRVAAFLFSGLLLPLTALEPSEPSRVAIEAAAARAVGSHDPDPFTRNPDWLAAPLLSLQELTLIFNHPINRSVDQDPRISVQDPDVLPLVRLNTVRTRFIDDRLRSAVQAGATQVVILSAGFDTRAYRFRPLLEKVKVFEVDRSATQAVKQRRIHDVFGVFPPNTRYVPFEPQRDKLADVLRRAGFEPAARSFFIWEGGSIYQSAAVVRAILTDIAQSKASSLVIDFAFADAVKRVRQDPASPQERFDAAWGEPWLFGIPEQPGAEAYFSELGFETVELLPVDSPIAARRYLTHRDQTIVGQGLDLRDAVPLKLAELVARRN